MGPTLVKTLDDGHDNTGLTQSRVSDKVCFSAAFTACVTWEWAARLPLGQTYLKCNMPGSAFICCCVGYCVYCGIHYPGVT